MKEGKVLYVSTNFQGKDEAGSSIYGGYVLVDHGNGVITRYSHASDILVKPGDIVKPGMPIIKSGNSGNSEGPHHHFEIIANPGNAQQLIRNIQYSNLPSGTKINNIENLTRSWGMYNPETFNWRSPQTNSNQHNYPIKSAK